MSDGERVRHICLDVGTTFIEIDQVLSTRTGIVGDEIAEELSSLQWMERGGHDRCNWDERTCR